VKDESQFEPAKPNLAGYVIRRFSPVK